MGYVGQEQRSVIIGRYGILHRLLAVIETLKGVANLAIK